MNIFFRLHTILNRNILQTPRVATVTDQALNFNDYFQVAETRNYYWEQDFLQELSVFKKIQIFPMHDKYGSIEKWELALTKSKLPPFFDYGNIIRVFLKENFYLKTCVHILINVNVHLTFRTWFNSIDSQLIRTQTRCVRIFICLFIITLFVFISISSRFGFNEPRHNKMWGRRNNFIFNQFIFFPYIQSSNFCVLLFLLQRERILSYVWIKILYTSSYRTLFPHR